jgi:hypothetical protein
MRIATIGATIVLGCLSAAHGEERLLDPNELKSGMVGELWDDGYRKVPGGYEVAYIYHVVDVIDKNKVIVSATVSLASGGKRPVDGKPTHLILHIDTTDLVDGKQYKPKGIFKVVGTEKLKGRTHFVLSPHSTEKKE